MNMNGRTAALGLGAMLAATPAMAVETWTLILQGEVGSLSGEDYDADPIPATPFFDGLGMETGDAFTAFLQYDADIAAYSTGSITTSYHAITNLIVEAGGFSLEVAPVGGGGIMLTEYTFEAAQASGTYYVPDYEASFEIRATSNDSGFVIDRDLPISLDLALATSLTMSLNWFKDDDPDYGNAYKAAFNVLSASQTEGAVSSLASPVPLPAPVLLLGAGLAGLFGVARRRRG